MDTTTETVVADLSAVAPEGHEWVLVDVTCSACSAVNQIHEQLPEWVAAGVTWECNACGAANLIGGTPSTLLDEVMECGGCGATFDGRAGTVVPDVDETGTWTCPECSTSNRDVTVGERATSAEAGVR